MTFGEKLLMFRAINDLSQLQLSEILGVTPIMVHRYEAMISKPRPKNKIIFENKMEEWEEKTK